LRRLRKPQLDRYLKRKKRTKKELGTKCKNRRGLEKKTKPPMGRKGRFQIVKIGRGGKSKRKGGGEEQ